MKGHIMISCTKEGPSVEFYGVSTDFGDMYEISLCETSEQKNLWKVMSKRTFFAQDVVLIIGCVGSIDWLMYNGFEVIKTIDEIPADSEIDHYVKTPIVIRLDNVVSEIN